MTKDQASASMGILEKNPVNPILTVLNSIICDYLNLENDYIVSVYTTRCYCRNKTESISILDVKTRTHNSLSNLEMFVCYLVFKSLHKQKYIKLGFNRYNFTSTGAIRHVPTTSASITGCWPSPFTLLASATLVEVELS